MLSMTLRVVYVEEDVKQRTVTAEIQLRLRDSKSVRHSLNEPGFVAVVQGGAIQGKTMCKRAGGRGELVPDEQVRFFAPYHVRAVSLSRRSFSRLIDGYLHRIAAIALQAVVSNGTGLGHSQRLPSRLKK